MVFVCFFWQCTVQLETLPLRCYCTFTQSWLSQFRADGIMQMKEIINVYKLTVHCSKWVVLTVNLHL